jgi:Fe-S cluster biogenesis protein NfuA
VSAVEERVAVLDRLLHAHAGGLELRGVASNGVVSVRYTGMCTGCPLRPLTTAATVRPALLDLPEVRDVVVSGGRTSDEADRRIAAALGGMAHCPAAASDSHR